jgi:hypothetical protein
MLRLLQSIFGTEKKGPYTEELVKQAIERVVDATDPSLRAVSGYRKKLRPAVVSSIDHVIALVDGQPPPVPLRLGGYTDDRLMKRFFISADDMRKILAGDRSLAEFLAAVGDAANDVHTMLAMEKEERVIFGAALSGDIVIRDVPQVTVSFDAHRFLDPSGDVKEYSFQLKKRAFDHLTGLALKRLSGVKSERKDLERWRALLQSKLNLLERGGWGFKGSTDADMPDIATVEAQLGQIEAQLQEVGGDDRIYDTYLDVVIDVLGHPEQHLLARSETIYVDRMGIKRDGPADDAAALTLTVLYNAEGRSLVVLPVILQGTELRDFMPDRNSSKQLMQEQFSGGAP